MRERNVMEALDVLFYPRSIAIQGASSSLAKWGFIIPSCIINGGYKGRLYPVNPNSESITPHKPVIVLKGGRTRAGRTAAASHTGVLAGTSAV